MNNINDTSGIAVGQWVASTSQTYFTKDSFVAPQCTDGIYQHETDGPTLIVTTPTQNLAYVNGSAAYSVTGTVFDYDAGVKSLTVNGAATTVATNGSFTKSVTLSAGANVITVVATDNYGNTKTVVRNMTYAAA